VIREGLVLGNMEGLCLWGRRSYQNGFVRDKQGKRLVGQEGISSFLCSSFGLMRFVCFAF